MKKLLVVVLMLLVSGCDNPVLNPDTSKAISEKRQVEILESQNIYYERIATALEKIANR